MAYFESKRADACSDSGYGASEGLSNGLNVQATRNGRMPVKGCLWCESAAAWNNYLSCVLWPCLSLEQPRVTQCSTANYRTLCEINVAWQYTVAEKTFDWAIYSSIWKGRTLIHVTISSLQMITRPKSTWNDYQGFYQYCTSKVTPSPCAGSF